ncbi:MarR family winged helix-turn-helix transcriptional regulator [Klugiella xanthotipulae]|nr:MarR family transcriptional regulator [Klugiella xanthotipulae]
MRHDLSAIDDALLRLRRIWEAPSRVTTEQGTPIDTSTVLIVDAITRLRYPDGPAHTPVHIAEVATRLDVTPSTASRLVNKAVAIGMVSRTPSPRDPRAAALHLTEEGEKLAHSAQAFREGYLARLVARWSSSELSVFATLLTRFANEGEQIEPSTAPR